MTGITRCAPVVHACLALAEGFDTPCRQLVEVTPANPLLAHLAQLERLEGTWNRLTAWLENAATPEQRLAELRAAYYRLFCQPGSGLSLYLHDWVTDPTPAQTMVAWFSFLHTLGVTVRRQWRQGQDHLSVVFEILGWLWDQDPDRAQSAWRHFVDAWFPRFLQQWQQKNGHPFYQSLLEVAQEVANEMGRMG